MGLSSKSVLKILINGSVIKKRTKFAKSGLLPCRSKTKYGDCCFSFVVPTPCMPYLVTSAESVADFLHCWRPIYSDPIIKILMSGLLTIQRLEQGDLERRYMNFQLDWIISTGNNWSHFAAYVCVLYVIDLLWTEKAGNKSNGLEMPIFYPNYISISQCPKSLQIWDANRTALKMNRHAKGVQYKDKTR